MRQVTDVQRTGKRRIRALGRDVWQITFSPSTLRSLHHPRGERGGGTRHGHSGIRVDNRNDLAGPVGRLLLEAGLIMITGQTSVGKRVDLGGRERDGRGDLLHGLDLVLERRGVG